MHELDFVIKEILEKQKSKEFLYAIFEFWNAINTKVNEAEQISFL